MRRQVEVDLEGRDESIRPDVRARGRADRRRCPDEERRAALVEAGYLTPHWPAPYGLGADAVTQIVIDEELARAGVARPDIVIAGWALPTILEHGDDEQRERFVTPSLLGELVWCQLFSEPGAGSDLASLRTRAERVDGGWKLTGQKVWNSVAERADWGICLARTDPDVPQHKGISYFLVDMKSEGIDVRPLREITGEALFNEVFLDDVFVPDDCLVGELDDGWKLARTTLANERVAMATTRLSKSTERAVTLVADAAADRGAAGPGRPRGRALDGLLAARRPHDAALAGRPGPRRRVQRGQAARRAQPPGRRRAGRRPAGRRARSRRAEQLQKDVWEMLNTRCLSIAGGTTQILRNVAGERILGLPRGLVRTSQRGLDLDVASTLHAVRMNHHTHRHRGHRDRQVVRRPRRSCAASTSPCPPAPCTPCSGPTAPARPPWSASCPRSSPPTTARPGSPGSTSATQPDGVRRSIGVTGQFSAIDELLTGRENLRLMADLAHLPAREAAARVDELLARFGLADAADRRAATYSGGMKRRLDLAMTLVSRPRVIFLDEPTTGLDPRSRRDLWQIVRELLADGVTIFLTTQYLEEADQLAHTVGLLDGGRLVATGTPAELKAQAGGETLDDVFLALTGHAATDDDDQTTTRRRRSDDHDDLRRPRLGRRCCGATSST